MQRNVFIFLCVYIYFFHSSTCIATTALKIEETRLFSICHFIFAMCLFTFNPLKGRILRSGASFFTTILFFTYVFLLFSQFVNYYFRFVTPCFATLIDQHMIDCHLETSIHFHVHVIPNFVSQYTMSICYATKYFLHSESFAANVYADCSRSFSKYIYQKIDNG
jgi:hypothetical protein